MSKLPNDALNSDDNIVKSQPAAGPAHSTVAGSRPLIAVYCIGGAGLNTGAIARSQLRKVMSPKELEKVAFYFADTSRSDTGLLDPEDLLYTVEGLEGCGKLRGNKDLPLIEAAVPKFMLSHPPGEYNIIIHSTSGGTGTTLGQMAAFDLLAKDEITTLLLVAGAESIKELRNSIDTIAGYSNFAEQRGIPVTSRLFVNSEKTPRDSVDKFVAESALALSAFFSREGVQGLDKADVRNFFRYEKVTNAPAAMVSIDMFNEQPPAPSPEQAPKLATLTIVDNRDKLSYEANSLYSASGVSGPEITEKYKSIGFKAGCLVMAINTDSIGVAFAQMQEQERKLLEISALAPAKTEIPFDKKTVKSSGLVIT